MRLYDFSKVDLLPGFLRDKQELNRTVTIPAVYHQYEETGRIAAFRFEWKEGDPLQPHFFWDSDVAKWMEGVSYSLMKHPDTELEAKVEAIIDDIARNQDPSGYFNIYFTVVEPEKRFTNLHWHELYCAGHLMEAAVAYARATGKERFLHLMEKYADHIREVFMEKKSAAFTTPGHEEIELALVKLYRYTKKKKYLDLAAFFINERGNHPGENDSYRQSHIPVREQHEALGHSVRAMYLYTAMADLALELKDGALLAACDALWEDVTERKMYVTGGIGSTSLGEAFTKPYDLPNEEAYTETCAGIGLIFFARRMLALRNRAEYADVIERAFYNGVLSGLSLSGDAFFYENPLEITGLDHFSYLDTYTGKTEDKRYPITQRVPNFTCSCCPPNLNRLLASLGDDLFGEEGDTLYINQFTAARLSTNGVQCEMATAYPNDGRVTLRVQGKSRVAVRIPGWCAEFSLDHPYTMEDGYAVVENDGEPITVSFDMTPFAVRAHSGVIRDAGRLCVQSGPIVYCAESVDNGENLHALRLSPDFRKNARFSAPYGGIRTLDVPALRISTGKRLYARAGEDETSEPATVHLIPYHLFANRGETDMLVWIGRE